MRIICFALLACAHVPCVAQSFIIDDADSYADFSFRKDADRLTCFYKTWNSDKNSSHYRTISFDGNLNITDTLGYRLKGVCSNLGNEENSKYSYHIFYTVLQEKQTINFLVTDKAGNTLATYEKTAEDFQPLIKKKIKKLSELRFENIKTDGQDADLLLLRISLVNKSGMLKAMGDWFAMDLLGGKLRWQMKIPASFAKSKTVAGKLVTLQKTSSGRLIIYFYDLHTGNILGSAPLHADRGNRTISFFEVDSLEVAVAGSDFGNSTSNKHGRFFLSRFDLMGHPTFDHVDTTERLSGNRLQLLGGAIIPDGDMILVGESYKLDASAMVAGTAASIALAVLMRNPSAARTMGNVQKIVQGIVSVRMSPDGAVKEFNTFAVDHRNAFSIFLKDDQQVYLRYKEQLWLYDLTKLSSPPQRFNTVALGEDVITFSGNLIGMRKDDKKREIILEKIDGL
jgi:hypothetical protein